jgi:hypothetical protein
MLSFFPLYIGWHYSRGLVDLCQVWGNFFWFVGHFFSIPLMFRTLFAPWRRLNEHYPRFFDVEAMGEALIVNVMMRIVGFIARVVLITIGILSYLFVLIAGMLALMVWISLPIAVPALVVASIPSLLF